MPHGQLDREARGCLFSLIKIFGVFLLIFFTLLWCQSVFIG